LFAQLNLYWRNWKSRCDVLGLCLLEESTMKGDGSTIYGGRDTRNLPAYSVAEVAKYLRLPSATLRSWVVGRRYPRGKEVAFFRPLLQPADASPVQLSFNNLIEAHVLKALRTEHGVSIKAVRDALDFAQKACGIEHLLLSDELRTGAADLFLDKYGQLINLSKSGQLAMKRILEDHLKRVERDQRKLPLRLFPFLARQALHVIAIDPFLSFGRPVIWGKGISTAQIADRIDAGESINDVADDYDLETWEVEEAIIYERAA